MICIGCERQPHQIPEYIDGGYHAKITPREYVAREEGTYNKVNGHFCCTKCYIRLGQPTGENGQRWVAP